MHIFLYIINKYLIIYFCKTNIFFHSNQTFFPISFVCFCIIYLSGYHYITIWIGCPLSSSFNEWWWSYISDNGKAEKKWRYINTTNSQTINHLSGILIWYGKFFFTNNKYDDDSHKVDNWPLVLSKFCLNFASSHQLVIEKVNQKKKSIV